MSKSLAEFRSKLASDASSRVRFSADVLNLLASHGVNVDSPEVLKKLNIDLDSSAASKFGKSLAADGWAVSVVSG